MKQRIYLDNNATTFLDPRIAEYLSEVMQSPYGNPSSVHSYGQDARGKINQARRTIANYLGVKPQEILFTSGGTEGMNTLLRGLTDGHIVSSLTEHACAYNFLQDNNATLVDPSEITQAVGEDTKLISVMSVNNETGLKNDIEGIAAFAHSRGIPVVVDAVAQLGKEPITIPKGVVGMAFSGHKIHAPQGIGFIYLRSPYRLKPLFSGSQEYGYRGGTENYLGILALAKAIELIDFGNVQALRDDFEKQLKDALPSIMINGAGPRISNVSNIAFPNVDGETLLITLDQKGVCASHGSACSSGALEPSRILLKMGIPLNIVKSSLRFSLSRMTTQADVDAAVKIITESL